MIGLSVRQAEVLRFIRKHQRVRGFSPSIREMSGALDCVPSVIHQHLEALERKGFIRRYRPEGGARTARAIEILQGPEEATT